jgi:hypothetical protein
MRVTLHAFDELNELRSSHSGVPNGKRHSKLGYLHVGDFVRFTENIALHNSNISNFGECIAATVLRPFRFNVLYGQILDFEAKSGGGGIYCKVNIYAQGNNLPFGLKMPETPFKIKDESFLCQTGFMVSLKLTDVLRTAYVRHESKFSDQDIGLLDVFMVSRRLDMFSNILIIMPRKEHASSSEAVLKNSDDISHFTSRPAEQYRALKSVRLMTLLMTCRRSEKQPPTNLHRTKMDPKTFIVLYEVFEEMSHKWECQGERGMFLKTVALRKHDQCIHVNADNLYKLQTRKRKWKGSCQYKKMYIRAFAQHHIDYLRTVFGYWFGIGARMYFPGRHSKQREGRSVTTDILMNIIAENHSGLVQRFDESGINGLSFQYDPETWDLTIRVRYLSVTVKYAKENALVPPCIWDTGDNNVRGMLSEVGTLFLYDYDYYKTLEQYTGQDMLMVGIQEDMFDEDEGVNIPMHKKRFSLAVSIIVNAIKEEANNMG